jgi:sialidase-1
VTVWASFDGGKNWPIKRSVYGGPSAYSSLAAGRPETSSGGWIYILLEGGEDYRHEGAYLARFNLSWLLGGKKTGDGEFPTWLGVATEASARRSGSDGFGSN